MQKAALEGGETREKITTELRRVIDEAERLLSGDGSDNAEALSDARSRIEAGLRKRARDAAATTDTFIHEHVWSTVGVGALAGLVLGMLIARR